MDCPRCNLGLVEQEYEGETVWVCDTCWGYWLTREQLDRIVASVSGRFSRSESSAVLRQMADEGDVDRQGAEAEPAQCPECWAPMERKRYHHACPVMIDECPAHGIWLDTGEIKDLQVFVARMLAGA